MIKDDKLREMKEQMLEKRIKSLEEYQGRQQVLLEQESHRGNLFPKTINIVEDYKQSSKTFDYPHMRSFGRRDRQLTSSSSDETLTELTKEELMANKSQGLIAFWKDSNQ